MNCNKVLTAPLIETSQNESESLSKPATNIATRCESQKFAPLTFERWLRTLESCPDLLNLEAKTSREIERYQSALRRWKESGFPSPEEPPEQWRHHVSAYTRQWILSQNQSENGQGHLGDLRETSRDETTNRIACDYVFEHGVRPVLTLLDILKCPCSPENRSRLLDKNNPDCQVFLELESLWQSLGCPRTELWQRLLLYFRDSDMVCSFDKQFS